MSAQHYAITTAAGDLLRSVATDEAEPQIELSEGEVLHAVPGLPPRPQGPGWVVRWQGGAWVQHDARTLAEVREQRWAQIKAEREAREFGGMVWDGSPFDTDETSQRRIQGAVQMAVIAQAAQQPFSIGWTLADDTVRTLDGAQMIAVGMALAQHVGSLHETGRLLRQQIDGAATVADVMAVSWPQE